ncbi:MAG: HpcH/HpaI aldolase/citrate lyase family protein [Micrococcales bacterium]|nr:HpcH/HpaI aldolase/citrate lyase family protein [Micrococcales bacterium]
MSQVVDVRTKVGVRHFAQLSSTDGLFAQAPAEVDDSDPRRLAVALGGTLYTPAVTPDLPQVLAKLYRQGVTTSVLCLEDAIADDQVHDAEEHLVGELDRLAGAGTTTPLLFVRPRTPRQVLGLVERLPPRARGRIAGFMLPKFDKNNGLEWLVRISQAERLAGPGHRYWRCPIMESPDFAQRESQAEALTATRRLLVDPMWRTSVLVVRIGATDLLSTFGLRRNPDMTIYDYPVVAQVIGSVVNTFGRADGFVVSGPVWEHFGGQERLLRPALRASPFEETDSMWVRRHLFANHVDGLLQEIEFDIANGLVGKTVIHPSHASLVNAMLVPSFDEWRDARDILAQGSGVIRSAAGGKMNEAGPHRLWAQRVVDRASVYGVAGPDVSRIDLLRAVVRADREKS